MGSIILVIVILLIIFIVRRNSLRRRKCAQKPLSQGQLEELRLKIVKECERESALCKKGEYRSRVVEQAPDEDPRGFFPLALERGGAKM